MNVYCGGWYRICKVCSCLSEVQYCPTLTKGSKWQITKIWESDVFRLELANFTFWVLEQKHSSCWKIFKSRHNDIALMSMYMADTFCSFTRNVIFKSCFLLSEYGRVDVSYSIRFGVFLIKRERGGGGGNKITYWNRDFSRLTTSIGSRLSNGDSWNISCTHTLVHVILCRPLFSRTDIFAILDRCRNLRGLNFTILLMFSLL